MSNEFLNNENFEQLELQLLFKNQINVISKLKRCKEPLISKVQLDECTNKINECFDFDFDGTNKFYPFEFNDFLKDLDFNILCIVGKSGAGKSTFSKYYGEDKKTEWDISKCILSNIKDVSNSLDEAIEKLGAVGLNTIPTWAKPYNVLSVGEKFRASLAKKLKNGCVIDEFTSNVDRNVALSCSKSIGKYIRKYNLKKCVFVSCHKDFIDTLCPDYVIDLDDEVIYDTRRLLQRKFELHIYEKSNKQEIWNIFKQYHYLSSELNVASKCFVAYLNDELVACCYVLPQPSGMYQNAFRIHRLVVLPDYQGLGIATKLLKYVCDIYKYHDKTMYLRTSNFKLINYMKNSKNWLGDGKLNRTHKAGGMIDGKRIINEKRLASTFKYIGNYENENIDSYKKINFIQHNDNYEQLLLFEEPKKEKQKQIDDIEIDENILLEAGLL